MVTAVKPTIHCVSGDGAERYRVPSLSENEDYRPAPDLVAIARQLQERHDATFAHLNECRVVYLWKREGGKSNGKETHGKCQKPSPLVKFLTGGDSGGADFIIWLAADHLTNHEYTRLQVEAILFHEMLHTSLDEPEEVGKPAKAKIVAHDVEAFELEVEVYGLWRLELRSMARTMAGQLPLFAPDLPPFGQE